MEPTSRQIRRRRLADHPLTTESHRTKRKVAIDSTELSESQATPVPFISAGVSTASSAMGVVPITTKRDETGDGVEHNTDEVRPISQTIGQVRANVDRTIPKLVRVQRFGIT